VLRRQLRYVPCRLLRSGHVHRLTAAHSTFQQVLTTTTSTTTTLFIYLLPVTIASQAEMWFMLSDYSNSECGAKILSTEIESKKICYTLARSLSNGGRFLQRDTMLARYVLWPGVCLSVCPAVTHRRVG